MGPYRKTSVPESVAADQRIAEKSEAAARRFREERAREQQRDALRFWRLRRFSNYSMVGLAVWAGSGLLLARAFPAHAGWLNLSAAACVILLVMLAVARVAGWDRMFG